MYNNDYMYAIERNDEYLAHYGVRGMKWGVRRAIASGNSARLGRQYAKAQKKLAKLEKQAGKSKKYARRAALMGAGAAIAGGAAALGTEGVANIASKAAGIKNRIKRTGLPGADGVVTTAMRRQALGNVKGVGDGIRAWGRSNSIATAVGTKGAGLQNRILRTGLPGADGTVTTAMRRQATSNIANARKAVGGISNNTIARIGAGAIGAGLAVGAARNAYKAATAQKRAAKFKSEMNKAFAGTKYANGGNRQGGNKKRRR